MSIEQALAKYVKDQAEHFEAAKAYFKLIGFRTCDDLEVGAEYPDEVGDMIDAALCQLSSGQETE